MAQDHQVRPLPRTKIAGQRHVKKKSVIHGLRNSRPFIGLHSSSLSNLERTLGPPRSIGMGHASLTLHLERTVRPFRGSGGTHLPASLQPGHHQLAIQRPRRGTRTGHISTAGHSEATLGRGTNSEKTPPSLLTVVGLCSCRCGCGTCSCGTCSCGICSCGWMLAKNKKRSLQSQHMLPVAAHLDAGGRKVNALWLMLKRQLL